MNEMLDDLRELCGQAIDYDDNAEYWALRCDPDQIKEVYIF